MTTNTKNPHVEAIVNDAVARIERLHAEGHSRKAPDPPTGNPEATRYKQMEAQRQSRKEGILYRLEEMELQSKGEFPEFAPIWAEARKLRR